LQLPLDLAVALTDLLVTEAPIGATFTILTASTISGLFKAPDGAALDSSHPFFTVGGARFEIFYDPTSVVLKRVPGPATFISGSPTSTEVWWIGQHGSIQDAFSYD
jgi:hypothetical protein